MEESLFKFFHFILQVLDFQTQLARVDIPTFVVGWNWWVVVWILHSKGYILLKNLSVSELTKHNSLSFDNYLSAMFSVKVHFDGKLLIFRLALTGIVVQSHDLMPVSILNHLVQSLSLLKLWLVKLELLEFHNGFSHEAAFIRCDVEFSLKSIFVWF